MSLLGETGHYTTTDADHVNWMEKCSNAFSIIARNLRKESVYRLEVKKNRSNPIQYSEANAENSIPINYPAQFGKQIFDGESQ